MIRKLLFTAKIRRPEMSTITYLPSTGISAIQIAAMIILA